jgi:small-conductance mechanosensitive channel
MKRFNSLPLLCISALLISIHSYAQTDTTSAQTEALKGSPVIITTDTLFRVFTRLGPFNADERAAAIAKRIEKITDMRGFDPDSVMVMDNETTTDIVYGEMIIMSITAGDAQQIQLTRKEAAVQYAEILKDKIGDLHSATSIKHLLMQIGLTILSILIFSALIYFLLKMFNYLQSKVELLRGTVIKSIRIKDYELMNEERILKIVMFLTKALKIFLIVLIVYLFLPVVFSIFPWTKGIADQLFGYILSPLKKILFALVGYIPNLLTILVIVFVVQYILKGIAFLAEEVATGELKLPGFYTDWARPTFNIIKFLVYAFTFVVIFPYLPGSDSPVFQGVSVFLGLLVSFGSAGSISNITAGIVLTYMRSFKMGDRIKIGEVTGDVIEKNLLVTRVRTIKNEDIAIPNSTILNNHITNFSTSSKDLGLIMYSTVTIGYDAPWRTVHNLLIDAALSTKLILKEPKPFVLQTSLDDFYVSYQLNAYTNDAAKQAVIYSELHANIQDKFNEGGVEIMSPHYRAMRDGNLVTIPADYLPKDYVAPAFKVSGENK